MITPADSQANSSGHGANPQHALEAVVRFFSAETGTLHAIGADGMLHLIAVVGCFPPPVMDVIRTIPVGKGLAGLAAQRKIPVTICNLQTDTSGDVRPGAKATGMEGAITVPCLVGSEMRVAGVLGVANSKPRTYSADEIKALEACASIIGALMPA